MNSFNSFIYVLICAGWCIYGVLVMTYNLNSVLNRWGLYGLEGLNTRKKIVYTYVRFSVIFTFTTMFKVLTKIAVSPIKI